MKKMKRQILKSRFIFDMNDKRIYREMTNKSLNIEVVIWQK